MTGSDQAERAGLPHGVLAGGDAELAIEDLRVALHRVDRQVEVGADLALGRIAGQRPQNGLLAVGQFLDQARRLCGPSRTARRPARRSTCLEALRRTSGRTGSLSTISRASASAARAAARSWSSSSTSARLVSATPGRVPRRRYGPARRRAAAADRAASRSPSRWASRPSTVRSRAIPGAVGVAPELLGGPTAVRHVGERAGAAASTRPVSERAIARMLAACRPAAAAGRAPAPGPTRRPGAGPPRSDRPAKLSIAPRTVRATTYPGDRRVGLQLDRCRGRGQRRLDVGADDADLDRAHRRCRPAQAVPALQRGAVVGRSTIRPRRATDPSGRTARSVPPPRPATRTAAGRAARSSPVAAGPAGGARTGRPRSRN